MPNATTIGHGTTGVCDIGEDCCPHPRAGTNATGSPDIFAEGAAVHRLSDSGPTNCVHGGTFNSVAGSPNVFVNGLQKTRIDDATVCAVCGQGGSHISGCQSVFVN